MSKKGNKAMGAAKAAKTAAKAAAKLAAQDYAGAAVELLKNPAALKKIIISSISVFLAFLILWTTLFTFLFSNAYKFLTHEDTYSTIADFNKLNYELNLSCFNAAYEYTSNKILDEIVLKMNKQTLSTDELDKGKKELFKNRKDVATLLNQSYNEAANGYKQNGHYTTYADCVSGKSRYFALALNSKSGYKPSYDRSSSDFSTWTENTVIIDYNNKKTSNLTKKEDGTYDYTSSKNKACYNIVYNNAKFYENSECISMLQTLFNSCFDYYNKLGAEYSSIKYTDSESAITTEEIDKIISLYSNLRVCYLIARKNDNHVLLTNDERKLFINNLAAAKRINYPELSVAKSKVSVSQVKMSVNGVMAAINGKDEFTYDLLSHYFGVSSLSSIDRVRLYYDKTKYFEKIKELVNIYDSYILAKTNVNNEADKYINYITVKNEEVAKEIEETREEKFLNIMKDTEIINGLFKYSVSVEKNENATNSISLKNKMAGQMKIKSISDNYIINIDTDFMDYDVLCELFQKKVLELDEFKSLFNDIPKSILRTGYTHSVFNSKVLSLKETTNDTVNSAGFSLVENLNTQDNLAIPTVSPTKKNIPTFSPENAVLSEIKITSDFSVKYEKEDINTDSVSFSLSLNDSQNNLISRLIKSNEKVKNLYIYYDSAEICDEIGLINYNITASLVDFDGNKIDAVVFVNKNQGTLGFRLTDCSEAQTFKSIDFKITKGTEEKDSVIKSAKLFISPITLVTHRLYSANATGEFFKNAGIVTSSILADAGYMCSNVYLQYKMKIYDKLFNVSSIKDTKIPFFVDPTNIAVDKNGKQMISGPYTMGTNNSLFNKINDHDTAIASNYYFVTVKPSSLVYVPWGCEITKNKVDAYEGSLWDKFIQKTVNLQLFADTNIYRKHVAQADYSTYLNKSLKNQFKKSLISAENKVLKEVEKNQIYNGNEIGVSYYEFRDAQFGYSVAGVQVSQIFLEKNSRISSTQYKNNVGAAFIKNPSYPNAKTYSEYFDSLKADNPDTDVISDITEPIILGNAISSQYLTKEDATYQYKEDDVTTWPTIAISVGALDAYAELNTASDGNVSPIELKDVFDLSTVDESVYTDSATGYSWPLVGSYETDSVVVAQKDITVKKVFKGSSANDNYIIASIDKIADANKNEKKDYLLKVSGLVSSVGEGLGALASEEIGHAFSESELKCSMVEYDKNKKTYKEVMGVPSSDYITTATEIKINPDETVEESDGQYSKVVAFASGEVVTASSKEIVVYCQNEELYYKYTNLTNCSFKEGDYVTKGTLVGEVKYDKQQSKNSLIVTIFTDGSLEKNAKIDKDNNIVNSVEVSLTLQKINADGSLVFTDSKKRRFYKFFNILNSKTYKVGDVIESSQVIGSALPSATGSSLPYYFITNYDSTNLSKYDYFNLLEFFPKIISQQEKSKKIKLMQNVAGNWTDITQKSLILNPKGKAASEKNINEMTIKANITPNSYADSEIIWIVRGDTSAVTYTTTNSSITIKSIYDKTKKEFKSGNITVEAKFKSGVGVSGVCNVFIPKTLQVLQVTYYDENQKRSILYNQGSTSLAYLEMNKILAGKRKTGDMTFDSFDVALFTNELLEKESGPTVQNYYFSLAKNDYFSLVNKYTGELKWTGKYMSSENQAPQLTVNYSDPSTDTNVTTNVKLYVVNPVDSISYKDGWSSDALHKVTANDDSTKILSIFSNNTNSGYIKLAGKTKEFLPTFINPKKVTSFLSIESVFESSSNEDFKSNFVLHDNGNLVVNNSTPIGMYVVKFSLAGNALRYSTVKTKTITLNIKVGYGADELRIKESDKVDVKNSVKIPEDDTIYAKNKAIFKNKDSKDKCNSYIAFVPSGQTLKYTVIALNDGKALTKQYDATVYSIDPIKASPKTKILGTLGTSFAEFEITAPNTKEQLEEDYVISLDEEAYYKLKIVVMPEIKLSSPKDFNMSLDWTFEYNNNSFINPKTGKPLNKNNIVIDSKNSLTAPGGKAHTLSCSFNYSAYTVYITAFNKEYVDVNKSYGTDFPGLYYCYNIAMLPKYDEDKPDVTTIQISSKIEKFESYNILVTQNVDIAFRDK